MHLSDRHKFCSSVTYLSLGRLYVSDRKLTWRICQTDTNSVTYLSLGRLHASDRKLT
jgi:hypothetical protein